MSSEAPFTSVIHDEHGKHSIIGEVDPGSQSSSSPSFSGVKKDKVTGSMSRQSGAAPCSQSSIFPSFSGYKKDKVPVSKSRQSAVDPIHLSLMNQETCTITGFTGVEKRLIWLSWNNMTCDEEEFGGKFFCWLLENVPNMLAHFSFGSIDRNELSKTERFVKHAKIVYSSLNEFITLLPFPEQMVEKITEMARNHLNRKVGKVYFGSIHENFHRFISGMLNEPSDSEIVKLWVDLMWVIYRVVEDEEDKLPSRQMSETKKSSTAKQKRKKSCCNCL